MAAAATALIARWLPQLANSAIRAEVEKALGKRFDIRAFHDALLKDGALPMSVLQAKMAQWIAAISR